MGFLETMLAHKREEVALLARRSDTSRPVGRPPRDFAAALRRPGLSIIAEIKRLSPSKGPLRENLDAVALAHTYEASGADAISCLTDERFFGARPDDLPRVASAVALPILRKEFIIDELQIHESRRMGADAVLLIVRILERMQLRGFLSLARELGMTALVETHDEWEVDIAVESGATVIGINNRDLETLQVSTETSLRLRRRIPPGVVAVAESGIRTREDFIALEQAGFDAVLVGESLITTNDPAARIAELRGDSGT